MTKTFTFIQEANGGILEINDTVLDLTQIEAHLIADYLDTAIQQIQATRATNPDILTARHYPPPSIQPAPPGKGGKAKAKPNDSTQ